MSKQLDLDVFVPGFKVHAILSEFTCSVNCDCIFKLVLILHFVSTEGKRILASLALVKSLYDLDSITTQLEQ